MYQRSHVGLAEESSLAGWGNRADYIVRFDFDRDYDHILIYPDESAALIERLPGTTRRPDAYGSFLSMRAGPSRNRPLSPESKWIT